MTHSGKIFPEYWVDCHDCRDCRCTGETTRAKAAKSAVQMGWKRIKGLWTCPRCRS